MSLIRSLLLIAACGSTITGICQQGTIDPIALVREHLLGAGALSEDLQELIIEDSYRTDHNGVQHSYIRQRWQGIEVWNGDIAIHTGPNGELIQVHNGTVARIAERVNTTTPVVSASTALATVLSGNLPSAAVPPFVSMENGGRKLTYDGTFFSGEPVVVQLVYQPVGDGLRLAWNVNHYTPDGTHWWNVRIDAVSGEELDRNDWVSDCGFDHVHGDDRCMAPEESAPPAVANDLNVYPWPVESPIHGPRAIRNAPWVQGGIASPFGWNDTNGAAGAEYTITRGNNVWAKEDIAADNETTIGYNPNGGATLDFDFPINLAGAPNTYQDALITNLYYWNNVIHDVWYGYGFNEPSGNFQQNNYGRGGTGNDYVLADAMDGSGTNNANFATPAEGTRPRMQMYVWTYTTPNRDSDLDNGVIAHEYGHGISNRLVGGPANTNCLGNAEQMGEGWSDFIALVMTIKAGDTGPMARGIGTYVTGQPFTGGGIRPAPYSTNFAVNNYTYAATNNAAIAAPHGIGFVWCTILWEMTWELIGIYGLDPNIYTGTGGNNIAMRLVIDGMKLAPCNPGFVTARDAILQADMVNNGGANQAALWAAFARRGLGASANQGSSASRFDQTEAFDMPLANNVGVQQILEPAPGQIYNCSSAPITVRVRVRNFGSAAQSNFPVRYRLDGGAFVTQSLVGPLASGASAIFAFSVPVNITGIGPHTLDASTNLAGDMYAADNQSSTTVNVVAASTISAPFTEGLATASPTPAGWAIENPDAGITWTTSLPAIGPAPGCGSSRVWSIDNYNYNGVGQEDRLLTPLISLAGLTSSTLKFDHAYARYSASLFDAFRVDISANCGGNWTQLFYQQSNVLATAPDATAQYSPGACAQWRNNTVNLSAYDGQTILLRFVGINGYGNWIYMDNVAVSGNYGLPVEFLGLTAETRRDGVQLLWSTASELNTDRFEVERSTDLMTWSRIGSRSAVGNTHSITRYDLLDPMPGRGSYYYRLRMVDFDSSFDFSNVVSAEFGISSGSVFPNPNQGEFTVTVADPNAPIAVLDVLGRSVLFARETTGDGIMTIRLKDPVPGAYFVRHGTGSELVRILVIP